ncbi:MAG TPA: HNH endonuclease [Chloroflexota bacterium]|jgi:5-methylcytosine-specific restriction endonuclease McrA
MMKRTTYRQRYLRTPHWLGFRTRAIARAHATCQSCGKQPPSLDVHHLSYARLGRERYADVLVLCRACHRRRHGRR